MQFVIVIILCRGVKFVWLLRSRGACAIARCSGGLYALWYFFPCSGGADASCGCKMQCWLACLESVVGDLRFGGFDPADNPRNAVQSPLSNVYKCRKVLHSTNF